MNWEIENRNIRNRYLSQIVPLGATVIIIIIIIAKEGARLCLFYNVTQRKTENNTSTINREKTGSPR